MCFPVESIGINISEDAKHIAGAGLKYPHKVTPEEQRRVDASYLAHLPRKVKVSKLIG